METPEISYPADYLPAKLLSLAIVCERRFMDIIDECPEGEDGAVNILEKSVLELLLDCRMTSIFMSMSALYSYLSYYGYDYSCELEGTPQGDRTLLKYLGDPRAIWELERASRNFIARHELIMERHGEKSIVKFLRSPLSELDKIYYFPLVRTLKLPNSSDPTFKTLLQLRDLRDDVLNPNFTVCSADAATHKPSTLLGFKPLSDLEVKQRFIREGYHQHNFLWEILHCAPPQTVQDFIRYIHSLDDTPVPSIVFMRAGLIRDESGEPIMQSLPKYKIEIE